MIGKFKCLPDANHVEEVTLSIPCHNVRHVTYLIKQTYDGVNVIQDTEGEYVRFIVYDKHLLQSLASGESEGIKFPCPIPTHPERLNDLGNLRMQVSCGHACYKYKPSPQ